MAPTELAAGGEKWLAGVQRRHNRPPSPVDRWPTLKGGVALAFKKHGVRAGATALDVAIVACKATSLTALLQLASLRSVG